MKITRQISLEEFKTLDNIKVKFKEFVAKSLSKNGKPTHPTNVVDVPGINTVDQVIYKKKTSL